MAAPKGVSYTPTRGPLAGQTFTAPAGRTSGYYAYQQSLARHAGFGSYTAQKTAVIDTVFRTLQARYQAVNNVSAHDARRAVGAFMRTQPRLANAPANPQNPNVPVRTQTWTDAQGKRKAAAIQWALDEGLYDDGDDAAGDIPY